MADWQPTTERFVAFFDIMGFKDLVLKKPHEEILHLLESLSESRAGLDSVNNRTVPSGKAKLGETKSFTFSDSIMFFSKEGTKEDLSKLVLDCLYLLKESFALQIPIKGAISYGKITLNHNNSIYFGQPIIDAFLLHEELHLYSVIADSACEKKISELQADRMLKDFFQFYKTPLKSGKINHYLLKPLPIDRQETLENLNKLYNTVAGKPRLYIDNTIEFIRSLEP